MQTPPGRLSSAHDARIVLPQASGANLYMAAPVAGSFRGTGATSRMEFEIQVTATTPAVSL